MQRGRMMLLHNLMPRPPLWVGWGESYHLQPCIGITICLYWFMYVWLYVCLSVCLSVCMYVCTCARKVGMSFLLCMQTKILHIHIMLPPPPCGWVGGGLHACWSMQVLQYMTAVICRYVLSATYVLFVVYVMYVVYIVYVIYVLYVMDGMYVMKVGHFCAVCKQRQYKHT